MREAPASAIITMLNCIDTCPMGLMKARDRVSREISVPRVRGPIPVMPRFSHPAMAMAPPMIAMST